MAGFLKSRRVREADPAHLCKLYITLRVLKNV